MRRVVVAATIVLLGLIIMPAFAATWSRYENGRYGYSIDIPPRFSEVAEAENGDGGVSTSGDGSAELRVWGGYLVVSDFKSDVADRVQSDRSEGWTISYDSRKAGKASWSGSRGDRVFYARAVKACDDSAAYFRIEYDRTDLAAYDAIVGRLVKSFRPC